MYKILDNINELQLDNNAYVYADTETIGLYGEIRLVQIYQSQMDSVSIIDTYKIPLEAVYEKLKNENLVFHNGHYDMSCFSKALNLKGKVFKFWDDTFLLGKVAFPHLESFSLDSMFVEVLGYDPYMQLFKTQPLPAVLKLPADLEGIKSKMQKAKWNGELTKLHYLYASLDVYHLPALFARVVKHLESDTYLLDKESVELMLQFQEFGLPVKKETRKQEIAKTQADINSYIHLLPAGLNVNSPKQVKTILKTDSADDYVLAKLEAQGMDLAKNIRACKGLMKKLSFLENKFHTDRVYGYFNVTTKSGRSSCAEQNLQQIPSKLKHIFETDKFFVYADFSNLELRTFAAMVGEYVMKSKLDKNEDLHTFSATKLFHKTPDKVTPKERSIAKLFNFSSLYGAGVSKRLQILLKNTGIILDEEKGRELAYNWLQAFPQVREWQRDNYHRWQNGLTGYTALGRPYKAKLYTDFGNLMIQGTGAEVSKLALRNLNKEIDISKLCVFIHDSYTFECDTLAEAEHYAKVLAHCMQEAWNSLKPKFKLDVSMPVEAVVGKNWKDVQSGENLLFSYEV